jgi:hypothetical protein
MNPGAGLQGSISPAISAAELRGRAHCSSFMDRLDKLLKGPDLITSDQATGPILDSTSLLERDVWQDAFDRFDIFADAESHAGLPVAQQQYLSDLRVDHSLYDTLALEVGLLDVWLRNNRQRPESIQVESFLRRRDQFGARTWIEQQEKLYLWATKNEQTELAASILGWRLLCQELAESLLDWSVQQQHDPRGRQIRLWRDSPGFYPQNRLRIWALRFLEDARAPQILAWETAVNREIVETQPGLLSGRL